MITFTPHNMRPVHLFVLLFFLSLIAGCNYQLHDLLPDDQPGPYSQTSTQVTQRIVASTVMEVGTEGLNKTSFKTRFLPASLRTADVAAQLLSVVSNLSFQLNATAVIQAQGAISLNIVSNVEEPAMTRLFVRMRLLNHRGLIGETIPCVIPLQVRVSGQPDYVAIGTGNITLASWQPPFTSAIDQTFALTMQGDFRQAVAQRYRGEFLIEVVQELTSTNITYYVDPSGSNLIGNGSNVKPWQSLAYAAGRVQAGMGHTLHLKSGVFVENQQINLPVGVNLQGEGPDKSVIQSSFNNFLIRLQSAGIENGNQQMSGFSIDGQNRLLDRGIYILNRNNVAVRNVNFSNIDITGLEVHTGFVTDANTIPQVFLTGIEIASCNFMNCAKDVVFPEGGGYSSGCLTIGHLQNALIHDIQINEDRGYGIKFVDFGWFKGVKIYNCVINVAPSDLLWGLDCAIELWNVSDDCELYNNRIQSWVSIVKGSKGQGKRSINIHHNRMVFPQSAEAIEACASDMEIGNNYMEGMGQGVAIWPGIYPVDNVLIHHNIFRDLSDTGIEIQVSPGLISNIFVYNNVFHSFKDGLGWSLTGARVLFKTADISANFILDNLSLKNNLLINTGTNNKCAAILTNGMGRIINSTLSYNCYYNVLNGNFDSYPGNSVLSTNNLTTNPLIQAAGDPGSSYYQPLAGSPLLGAGRNVGLPFSGNTPNIGVF